VARAAALFGEGLQLLVEINEQPAIPDALEDLAGVALDAGDPARAARLLAAAAIRREQLGFPLSDDDRAKVERDVAAARAALGECEFTAAWTIGRSWTLKEAVDVALEQSAGATPPTEAAVPP
jgi:hypothetical protein